MNISISKAEYDALFFAIDQIGTEIQAASDEGYIESASNAIKQLTNIVDKYRQSRYRQQCLNEENKKIRKIIKEHPYETHGLSISQVKRLIYRGKKI